MDYSSLRHLGALENESVGESGMPQSQVSSNSLTAKYLWLSLFLALVPLVGFASLYDSYFSQLVTRLTEEQLATRMAATQNEFRVFLRERKFELEALADQFDNPEFFTQRGRQEISSELEVLLRLQVDAVSVYGIVFYDNEDHIAWTFPKEIGAGELFSTNTADFEGSELIGPAPYSIEHPPWVILRQSTLSNTHKNRIGLVIRFNSLAETLRGLDQGNIFRVFLRAGDGNTYDVVGQPVKITQTSTQQSTLLPNWSLHVIQTPNPVMSSVERMRYWLILLVGGTVASLLWLHMSISRRLNKQVESLIQSVEKVALGDLDTPVTAAQGREISRLTFAIERMRLQLKTFIRSTLKIERQATLGQLAAGLAHEIRNPLTTIRTTVIALSRREANPEHREMMNVITEDIDRVNEVLEHLLNFARPRDPNATEVDALSLLNSISILGGASARNQGIKLTIQSPRGLQLWIDEGHVRQILMNLIINALQAMSVRGSAICLQAIKHKNEIELSVTDDGQGMSEAIKAHIMEPFFTTKPAGTGLGLATCNTLVNSNGGRMIIKSVENEGTKVSLFFPIASANQE